MIKASAKMADGQHLLVLGLSDGNLQRLKHGDPIAFDVTALHIPKTETVGKIMIFYGATEEECFRTIRSLIGAGTEVFHVPRGSNEPT